MNTSQKIDRLTSLIGGAIPLRGSPMRAMNPAFKSGNHHHDGDRHVPSTSRVPREREGFPLLPARGTL